MPDTYVLPFELTVESVDEWLGTLDRLPHAEKVNRINRMINELSKEAVDAMRLFPVLDKLTEPFLMLSNILERMAISENNPSEKSRKLTSFAIQLPKKLSIAYCKLADDRSATAAQRALAIYRAMQILCLLIKRNTLFYEAPDLTLWKKLAELYGKADVGHFLTVDIDDKVPGLVYQPTIEAVLKHALLFYICNAYQYSPTAISDLFVAVASLAPLIKLDNESSEFTLCYWDPAAQLLPQSVNQAPTEEQALYIDTSALVDYFETHQDQLKNCQALVPALKRLTAYADIRRSVAPSTQKECGLIIGIAQAMKFLNALTSRYRILELSGAIGHKPLSSNLELVPLDDGKNALAFLSTKILKDDTSLSFAKIKTFQTRNLQN